METVFYVYLYLRKDFYSPYYVGKGTGDRCYVRKHSGRCCSLPPAERIRKVAENLTDAEACELEKKLILFYGKKSEGGVLHNRADGGTGGATRRGQKHTEETKRKISKGNKGKTRSEETREKIRQTSTGRKHTEEAKRKCSVAGKKARGVPKPSAHNRKGVIIHGVFYPSQKAAGKVYGLSSAAVLNRIRKGWEGWHLADK